MISRWDKGKQSLPFYITTNREVSDEDNADRGASQLGILQLLVHGAVHGMQSLALMTGQVLEQKQAGP